MNKIICTLAVLTLSASGGEKLAVLKLSDGTEYKAVEIMGVSPKGVRILHASGAASVAVHLLPEDLQKKYGDAQKKAADETPAPATAPKTDAPIAPQNVAPPKKPFGQKEPLKPREPEAPPQIIVSGKIYGLAEVMADRFKLDGKIARVEVIANSASRIEAEGPGLYKIFVGDPFTKRDSDWMFITFPEEGKRKIESLLTGARGKMTLYMEITAADGIPLHAVGRSTVSGSPGSPVTIKW